MGKAKEKVESENQRLGSSAEPEALAEGSFDTTAAPSTQDERGEADPSFDTSPAGSTQDERAGAGDERGDAGDERAVLDDLLDWVEGFEAETLVGDLRDFFIEQLRTFDRPWAKLTEAEQRQAIDRATLKAEVLTAKAVRLIAPRGFAFVPVEIDSVTIRKGVKTTVLCARDQGFIRLLGAHQGGSACLVFSDPAAFAGEKRPVRPDPDQPSFDTGPSAPTQDEWEGVAERMAASLRAEGYRPVRDGVWKSPAGGEVTVDIDGMVVVTTEGELVAEWDAAAGELRSFDTTAAPSTQDVSAGASAEGDERGLEL